MVIDLDRLEWYLHPMEANRKLKLNRGSLVLLILLACLVSACHMHPKPAKQSKTQKSGYTHTRDGYYRVRKGDSLHAIAFNFGLDWRDIASLNHIASPYIIYPDQELRLPSTGQAPAAAKPKSSTSASTSATTSASRPVPSSTTGQDKSRVSTTALKTPEAATTTASAPTQARPDPSKWLWPTKGRIISNFKVNDPARNGIEIGGKEGQAIISTASGEVVYSGNGLIGYGELLIIKHNDRMLSAYAHNRKRLVSEGQRVDAGTQIAEMGRNDRNQAVLHFEIRINGSPVNPLKYLPVR